MKRIFLSIITASLFFVSCKKDSTTSFNSSVKAELSVEFDNVAGSQDLQLNTGKYKTANGDSITSITKLKYFVSNFSFTNVNGTVYTVPQDSSYHLVVEGDSSTYEPSFDIPEGEYKSVTFVLGVDSVRNTLDASKRTGDLDVTGAAADMYWTWNSGYIFYKLEGTSPQVPSMGGMGGNSFYYHIGLFGGKTTPTINNIKTITLDLTARGTPKVKAGKETNIHLMVDVLKMFSGANTVNIAAHPMVMTDAYSASIAANFTSGMFRHDHTEN